MSNLPKPQYTLWNAISAALALATRAIEEVRTLAREPGPKGDPGDPGPVGLGVNDFNISHDGERCFTFSWSKGDRVEERKFIVPVVLDRGVYRAESDYEKGDAVSFGGSVFIAQRATKAKPETQDAADDWRLAVKRGRDGKDGQMLPPKQSGPLSLK